MLKAMCFTGVLTNLDDFCSHRAHKIQGQIDSERQPIEELASDGSWNDLLITFGSTGKRKKNDENNIIYERFAIFGRIWLQHGTFVVQWLGRHFHTILVVFWSPFETICFANIL